MKQQVEFLQLEHEHERQIEDLRLKSRLASLSSKRSNSTVSSVNSFNFVEEKSKLKVEEWVDKHSQEDADSFLDTFKLTNTMHETKKPVMTAKRSTPFPATTGVKRSFQRVLMNIS